MELQRRHASVRRYSGEPIADDLLAALLSCGQAAASSSFVQAYSVIRVSDHNARQVIAEAAGGQPWIEQAAEFLVFCADLLRISRACEKAHAGPLEGYTEHGIVAIVDVSLMAQNVLLAAESKGLGGVFIGGIRNDPDTVADLLGLPAQVIPVFGMCLGWPVKRVPVKPRLPVAAILHQDRYDASRIDRQLAAYDAVMGEYYTARAKNAKSTTWSEQTAAAMQGKKREHMLKFVRQHGFFHH
jgi:nitroreductase